jgi:4-amino-4-deoxy-L-arabinose transferase-like glycosyltransferase
MVYIKLANILASGHLASSSSYYSVYVNHNALLSLPNQAQIVEPWFDHPPFFSIIDIPFWFAGLPKLLPILLGALSTLLIMYLLRQNKVLAILAGAIFAVYPFAVQLNGMMLLDNGAIFFFLLTLALTSKYEKNKSDLALLLAAFSAGLSFLCKEIGVYAILFMFLYVLYTRKTIKATTALKATLIPIAVASTWVIFGLLSNPSLFLDIIATQLNHITGQIGYQALLTTSVSGFSFVPVTSGEVVVQFGSVNGLLLFSWICLGILLFDSGHKIVRIGILSILVTLFVMKYAWFFTWVAIYPFFAIAIASVIYTVGLKTISIVHPPQVPDNGASKPTSPVSCSN